MSLFEGLMSHFQKHKTVCFPVNDPTNIGLFIVSLAKMGYQNIQLKQRENAVIISVDDDVNSGNGKN